MSLMIDKTDDGVMQETTAVYYEAVNQLDHL